MSISAKQTTVGQSITMTVDLGTYCLWGETTNGFYPHFLFYAVEPTTSSTIRSMNLGTALPSRENVVYFHTNALPVGMWQIQAYELSPPGCVDAENLVIYLVTNEVIVTVKPKAAYVPPTRPAPAPRSPTPPTITLPKISLTASSAFALTPVQIHELVAMRKPESPTLAPEALPAGMAVLLVLAMATWLGLRRRSPSRR